MLAILNKVVTNLGSRCQAHTTICANLGLFLLRLTEVEDRFDYFRPWVGENICHQVHRCQRQTGEGREEAAQSGPRPVQQVPEGLLSTQAPLEDVVPRCLKNQVGKIRPGLKGLYSHLPNPRKFWAHPKTPQTNVWTSFYCTQSRSFTDTWNYLRVPRLLSAFQTNVPKVWG